MPSIKMTVRSVEAIKPPEEGQTDFWDEDNPGFGMRVSSGGRRAWVVMYRHGGVKRRLTLGAYPTLSLADARELAAKAQHRVEFANADPAAEKRADRKAETFGELVEDYIARHAKVKKRSWYKDKLILEKDALPLLGKRKAKSVTRRDIIEMLDAIVKRGAPIQANRALEVVRKVFNWAIEKDILESTPCHMIKKPSDENQRDRVLKPEEIRLLWHGLDNPDLKMTRLCALVLKLQLVTAQRKGEVVAAELSEFDIKSRVWTIPAYKAKNGLAHRVPLSRSALAILVELRALERNRCATLAKRLRKLPSEIALRPWLFPSPRGETHIHGQGIDHALSRNLDTLGIFDLVPHDLRRTGASLMTGMGINRLVVSKILNHAEIGITKVYDRHGYDIEKKQALEAWNVRLKEIVSTDGTAHKVKKIADATTRPPT